MVRQAQVNDPTPRPRPLQPSQDYLICSLYGGQYGIDASRVRHIGRLGRIWSLPLLPDYVMGVTMIGDRLIPLIDLRLKLGLPEAACHERTCVVEVDVSVPLAVAVDSVERVRTVSDEEALCTARVAARIGSRSVVGMVREEDRLCLLLDIDWLLMGGSCAANQVRPPSTLASVAGQTQHRRVSADEVSVQHEGAGRSGSNEQGMPISILSDAAASSSEGMERASAVECFAASQPEGSLRVHGVSGRSDRARAEYLADLLAKPVLVQDRRIPGFRSGDPRLAALAIALLRMPPSFQTKEAAPVTARLLGCTADEYRITHFRYDLTKLRARYLAERVGRTRRYRLTGIGRVICRVLGNSQAGRALKKLRATPLPYVRRSALSA